MPAAAALVFAIDDFDERVSDWAVEHRPLFGSERGTRRASSVLRSILTTSAFGSALLTPSGADPGEWTASKLRGLGVEWAARGVTVLSTHALQESTNRMRPNRHGRTSFPSAHASQSFAAATLLSRNLDSISLSHSSREALRAGGFALAGLTAWARVEGEHHFPSDVLAGAALGNFLAAFVHDAFLGLPEPGAPTLQVTAGDGSFMIGINVPF
ncbi:MAG: phosphatase PAP2 family protein [Planctomycetes bacterium]|nr:phosphatase PAP2 family protein [Planctomycetota bacterium]